MEEYKNLIDSSIRPGAFDILKQYMPFYCKLCSIPEDLDDPKVTLERKKIQIVLSAVDFVEIYYQLYTKKSYQILETKYSPIIDALSSKYHFEGFILNQHTVEYYKQSKYIIAQEFFANAFAAEVTSRYSEFENLKKLLPKSFAAFENLFSIIYNHIQSNKRFTDLLLKVEDEEDE